MTKRIGPERRKQLIENLLNAEHDVVALAEAHNLSPSDLAAWIGDDDNHRCLAALCVLADLQTQLMLSRYRMLAVSRLIRQATQQEEDISTEQARKACVDLLKLDLKRADAPEHSAPPQEHLSDRDLQMLRQCIYDADDQPPPAESAPHHHKPAEDQTDA